MKYSDCLSLDDFEAAALRRLPHPLFQYVHGGVEDNNSRDNNRATLQQFVLMPRVLRDVTDRSTATHLFDTDHAAPFGIAPMGVCALNAYRGDIALARAAAAARIPMIVSATSLIPLEEIHAANPDAWFQAYLKGDDAHIAAMIDRVERTGFSTLVVTVDLPVMANRENNVRAGFTTPLRPSLRLAWAGLTRPRWLIGTFAQTLIRHGMPHFENSASSRGQAVVASTATRDFSGQSHLNWQHIAKLRDRWRGRLVLKGILAPDDIKQARACGIDAVIASNHGGRQLDSAISPLLILPELVAAAGAMPVLLDGGIRRGGDVIKALALGAAFVFVGRPFNYAASVGGEAGVRYAADLLRQEVDRTMAMLGCRSVTMIDESCIRRSDGSSIAHPTPSSD